MSAYVFCLSFFFFQAEDGIRDTSVTGVQTCALPISLPSPAAWGESPAAVGVDCGRTRSRRDPAAARTRGASRSEERRVGKECRARGAPEHQKKQEEEAARYGKRRSNRIQKADDREDR